MFQKIINGQYRHPRGWLGHYIGRQMVTDHQAENLWTVAVLAPQPNERILEIGFGPGFAIEQLSKQAPRAHIAGIDFSKTMVRAAKRRNIHAVQRGLVDLRVGNAAQLPFNDARFDKVYSIHSIYFWPTPLDALQEIWRVLKPGGWLVLTVLPKERWNEEHPEMVVGTPECTPYSGSELVTMLTQAGFCATQTKSDTVVEHRSNFSVIGVK